MKKEAILKEIAKDLGTSDLAQINLIFKAETFNHIKYKMMGKKLGYLGFTVNIKNIANDGLKVFLANKVKLIKFEDIEKFEKAKPRVKRPVREKKAVVLVAKKSAIPEKTLKDNKDVKDKKIVEEPDALKESSKNKKMSKPSRKKQSQGSRFIPGKTR